MAKPTQARPLAGVMALASEHCQPLPRGSPHLGPGEIEELRSEISAWEVEGDRLVRRMRFADFPAALAFATEVGRLAEAEQHHPDLHLTRGRNLAIETTTHSVGGLTRNDFVLAARIERLPGVPR